MPTRSASDYTTFVKLQAQAQSKPALTRTTPYVEGGRAAINTLVQYSEMANVTQGKAPAVRVAPRQFVQNRSNPKALSQVGFLGSAGPLGQVVNRPQPRYSGTSGLVVLQTNLIQNAGARS